MILGVTLDQALLILFAGGPGLTALIIQIIKHRGDAPIREANLAKTLTTTAGGMLDRMQLEIDALKAELRTAEDKIIVLEERIRSTQEFTEEAAKLKEKNAILELEIAKLRAYNSGALKDRRNTQTLERIETSLEEAKEFRIEVADKLSDSIARADAMPISSDYGAAADAALRSGEEAPDQGKKGET